MSKKCNSFFFAILIIFLPSCDTKRDKGTYILLSQWDTQINSAPQAISDSLKKIDPRSLSRENRAYYNLLKTISDDKTFFNFTTDSLIDNVVDYYQRHEPYGNNYIRALTYKAIIRTRMGVTDSTVYEPLKNAYNLFQNQRNQDPTIGYILKYFLGNTHYTNANFQLSEKYFEEALQCAKQTNDSIHIFDSYFALFWNDMIQNKLEDSKKYLDSLAQFYDLIPDKNYFILNAQSAYYETMGHYKMALDYSKKQLTLSLKQKEAVDQSNILYNISYKYLNINELDSAMHYAQLAIDNDPDNDKKDNYLIFDNAANIAEKQEKYSLANAYRRKAFEAYEVSVKDRLDTQVMELEKKYDLSEAQNRTLQSRAGTLSIAILALLLIILLGILFIINVRIRKTAKLKLMMAQYEVEKRASRAKLLEEEANKRNWLLEIYGYISNRLTWLQENFETLSQRYVSSQPKVYENMRSILHATESDLRDMSKTLIPDENTFSLYTNLSPKQAEIFNANEKIMLLLLTCKADNRQIATFMNTSVESIRVRKSQLKKKLIENEINPDDFFNF